MYQIVMVGLACINIAMMLNLHFGYKKLYFTTTDLYNKLTDEFNEIAEQRNKYYDLYNQKCGELEAVKQIYNGNNNDKRDSR